MLHLILHYNEDSNETKPKFKIRDREKIAGSFYEKELQKNQSGKIQNRKSN